MEELSGSEALSSLALEWRALLMKPTRRRSFPGSGSQPGTNGWGGGKLLRLLCAREGDVLVGSLPLSEEERRLKRWRAWRRPAVRGEAGNRFEPAEAKNRPRVEEG